MPASSNVIFGNDVFVILLLDICVELGSQMIVWLNLKLNLQMWICAVELDVWSSINAELRINMKITMNFFSKNLHIIRRSRENKYYRIKYIIRFLITVYILPTRRVLPLFSSKKYLFNFTADIHGSHYVFRKFLLVSQSKTVTIYFAM